MKQADGEEMDVETENHAGAMNNMHRSAEEESVPTENEERTAKEAPEPVKMEEDQADPTSAALTPSLEEGKKEQDIAARSPSTEQVNKPEGREIAELPTVLKRKRSTELESEDDLDSEPKLLRVAKKRKQTPRRKPPPAVTIKRVDLGRLKALIFATGRRIHGVESYHTVFMDYWMALSRRLSENLSREEFGTCQREIRAFLKTKKLRVLHNKLILGR